MRLPSAGQVENEDDDEGDSKGGDNDDDDDNDNDASLLDQQNAITRKTTCYWFKQSFCRTRSDSDDENDDDLDYHKQLRCSKTAALSISFTVKRCVWHQSGGLSSGGKGGGWGRDNPAACYS